MMLIIFLAFGCIRKRRNDRRKHKGEDRIEEMLKSFGMKDINRFQLLTIDKSFDTKLNRPKS